MMNLTHGSLIEGKHEDFCTIFSKTWQEKRWKLWAKSIL